MKRLQVFIALMFTLISLHTVSASSLNDNAVIALDGNLADAGCQGVMSPAGIRGDELVGFGIYAKDFSQLRAFSIDLSWTGDAELVAGITEGMTSGTSIPGASCTINGSSITVAAEAKLFDNELTVGEEIGAGTYQNYFALGGGSAPASSEYRLLYVAVFRTSTAFNTTDMLQVTASVTLGDDAADKHTPEPLVFTVNGTQPVITVLGPADGAVYAPGDICRIAWECQLVDAVDLSYRDPDGAWKVIGSNIDADLQEIAWTIPGDLTGDIMFRLTDSNNTEVTATSSVISVVEQASYYTLDVSNTGNSATVLFTADNPPAIDGAPVEAGDEIGVFTPRGECAGSAVWDGGNCALTIWGDDPTESGTAGFLPGESYLFRVWDMSSSREYDLEVFCTEGDCLYGVNTVTVVDSANVLLSDSLTIQLPGGWNMISSNVTPENPAMDAVFADIAADVDLVKNGNGEVYWPEYGVNQIGDWRITDGYQVRMNSGRDLRITGNSVSAGEVDFFLAGGWNMVSYLGTENDTPANAFAGILDQLTMVKSGNGDMYWPKRDVDQIGAMHHGEGYQIKLSDSYTGTVYRPAAGARLANFNTPVPTGNNGTIMVPGNIMPTVNGGALTTGDEIGVFAPSGACIGAGRWEGENLAITVWGDDPETEAQDGIRAGEDYEFRIWDAESMTEYSAGASYLVGGSEYEVDAIVVLESLAGATNPVGVNTDAPWQFALKQNHPNPFNPVTSIEFTLPRAGHVTLTVYSSLGEKVTVLVDNMLEAGTHEAVWDGARYGSGMYFYRLDAGEFSDAGKMTLIK